MLVILRNFFIRGLINRHLDYFCEVSGSVESHSAERVFIAIYNIRNSLEFRVKNIPIQREAMRRSIDSRRDLGSEPVHCDISLSVIALQNITHRVNSLEVLILTGVKEVKRLRRFRIAIR